MAVTERYDEAVLQNEVGVVVDPDERTAAVAQVAHVVLLVV